MTNNYNTYNSLNAYDIFSSVIVIHKVVFGSIRTFKHLNHFCNYPVILKVDMRFTNRGCDKNAKRVGRNGNSIQSKQVGNVRGDTRGPKRTVHRRIRNTYLRNRSTYVPCNSPLIKETVVMLQDDPRSPYGKNFYNAQTAVDKPNLNISTVEEQSSKKENYASSSDKQTNRAKTSKTTHLHARELHELTRYRSNKQENMEIAIVAEGTSISKSQVNLIETHLLNRIDVIPEGGPSPGFTHLKYKSGRVIVCCSNKTSRDWLVSEINNRILWDDIKLKVIEANKIANLIKTVVQIPSPYIHPRKLLWRLRIQNVGLDTTPWQVVGENPDKESYTYFIDLDERSWKKIMNLDRKLYFNFTRITFKTTNDSPLNNIPRTSENEETTQQVAVDEPTGPAEDVQYANKDPKVDINFQKEEFFISAGELMIVDSADDHICKVDEPISFFKCEN